MARWNKKAEQLGKKIGKGAEKLVRTVRDDVREFFDREDVKVVLKKAERLVRDGRDEVNEFFNSEDAKKIYKEIKKFSKKAESEARDFFKREDIKSFIKTVEVETSRIAKQAEDLVRNIRDKLTDSKSSSSEDALKALEEVEADVQRMSEDPEFALDNSASVISSLSKFDALLEAHVSAKNADTSQAAVINTGEDKIFSTCAVATNTDDTASADGVSAGEVASKEGTDAGEGTDARVAVATEVVVNGDTAVVTEAFVNNATLANTTNAGESFSVHEVVEQVVDVNGLVNDIGA